MAENMGLVKKSSRDYSLEIRSILRSLDITFTQGKAFWLLNEGSLDYILADFKTRARKVKARLHPDAPGGNEKKFQRWADACRYVESAFARRGIGVSAVQAQLEKESLRERRLLQMRLCVARQRQRQGR